MQKGKPSLLLPDQPLPGLTPVLVDVCEAIERIREEGDTVLLMEQHALCRLRDHRLPVGAGGLASSTCWAMHPSCSMSPSSPQPTWKVFGESDRL
jgi:hypothetical protein